MAAVEESRPPLILVSLIAIDSHYDVTKECVDFEQREHDESWLTADHHDRLRLQTNSIGVIAIQLEAALSGVRMMRDIH